MAPVQTRAHRNSAESNCQIWCTDHRSMGHSGVDSLVPVSIVSREAHDPLDSRSSGDGLSQVAYGKELVRNPNRAGAIRCQRWLELGVFA